MTKTKVSTIAIVVLSVLLAAALAATIVLAAFSFARTASTTITFAGGITLTTDDITNGTINAYSLSTAGAYGDPLAATNNVTTGVALSEIVLANSGTQDVKVAVALINGSDTELYVGGTTRDGTATTSSALADSRATANFADGASTLSATNSTLNEGNAMTWSTFVIAGSGSATVVNTINTGFTAQDVDGLASKTVNVTVYFVAVYDDSNADANLTNAIAQGGWTAFNASV